MNPAHLTLEQLIALRDGRLSPEELLTRWLRHLRETCPECGEAFRRLEEYRREKRRTDPARYATAIARLAARTPEMGAAVEAEQRAAQADLDVLLDLKDQKRRLARIRGTPYRMNSVALVDLLLDEARTALSRKPPEELPDEARSAPGRKPHEALRLLECAAAIVARLPTRAVNRARQNWLSLRVEAHRANALRVLGDLVSADSLWRSLNDQLEIWPAGSPDEDAELWSLEASLRTDLRQFDDALRLLARAERIYRRIGDPVGLAKTLVQQANATNYSGDDVGALKLYGAAAELVDPVSEPSLCQTVQHNLADSLINLGRLEEAEAVLDRSLATFGDSEDPVRLQWLCGKIARARGDLDEAAQLLRSTVNDCITRDLDYDAALAHLDLAEVLLRQGDTAEVKRLARAMEPVFRSKAVQREATAALLLYLAAAVAEQVDLALVGAGRRLGERQIAGRASLPARIAPRRITPSRGFRVYPWQTTPARRRPQGEPVARASHRP